MALYSENIDQNEKVVSFGSVNRNGTLGWDVDQVEVTLSATLKQGSILKADGTELAVAAAADARYVIDDFSMRTHREDLGDSGTRNVVVLRWGHVLNEDVVAFSDAAVDTAGKAALEVYGHKFTAPILDTDVSVFSGLI